jgi:glycosyltransferase involved in cell wall biosynthesis
MTGYQVKASISQFTQEWTQRQWEISTQVLYPPSEGGFGVADKQDIILSVGRFATRGHTKKQMEMMTTFQKLKKSCPPEWTYCCAGSLDDYPEDQAFFADVQRVGTTCGAQAVTNLRRDELKHQYERAKIFWHATGLGIDEEKQPADMEHYGITTVEAMAAGCVPIVINKGGQKEIVQHGVSGFLWNTLEELQECTLLVMRDEALRRKMSDAARTRAAHFSRDSFVSRTMDLLQPLFL